MSNFPSPLLSRDIAGAACRNQGGRYNVAARSVYESWIWTNISLK